MRKFLIPIFCFLTILFFNGTVLAQEENLILSNSSIEVELEVGTQSVLDKSVPLTVKFRTNFDSDNVEISWDEPHGIKIEDGKSKFVALKANEAYVYETKMSPEIAGDYNITANITAWQFNTNYTSSDTKTVVFDNNLILSPQSPEYVTMNIIKYVIVVIIGGVSVYGLVILSKRLKKTFVKWFNLPK